MLREKEEARTTLTLPWDGYFGSWWEMAHYQGVLADLGQQFKAEGYQVILEMFEDDELDGLFSDAVLFATNGTEEIRILPHLGTREIGHLPYVGVVERVKVSWPKGQAYELGNRCARYLVRHLGTPSQEPGTAWDHLQQAYEAFRGGNVEACGQLAETARADFADTNEVEGAGIALYFLALCYEIQGALSESKASLLESLDLLSACTTANAIEYRIQGQTMLGDYFKQEGHLDEAEQAHRTAYRLASQSERHFTRPTVCRGLSRVLLAQGNAEDAMTYAQEAITLLDAIHYLPDARRMRGESYSLLGDTFYAQGARTRAQQAYKQALDIYAEFPDQLGRQRREARLKLQALEERAQ